MVMTHVDVTRSGWGRGVSGRAYRLDRETRGGGASDARDVAALPGRAGVLLGPELLFGEERRNLKSADFFSWRTVVGQGPREYARVVREGDAVAFAYLESLQDPAVDLYCFGCPVRWGG